MSIVKFCHHMVANRESGVSDVIGAILLVSVVVISIAVISTTVLTGGTPEKIPSVEAVISNLDRTVFVYHNGGDILQNNEITILVNGLDKTGSFSKNSDSSWKTWSVGESLVYTAPESDTISEVKIIYTRGSSGGSLAAAQFGPGGLPTQVPVIYPPSASFNGTPTTQFAGYPVVFADTSINSPSSWLWDFGDGTNSTQRNPSHTYALPGTYSVTLTATNSVGSSTATRANYITITPPPPVALFSGTPVSGTLPLTVAFTDSSTNSPTIWSWNFGDGGTSNVQNPSHTYGALGTYNVTLTVTNGYGSNSTTKLNYITVSPQPPVASFTAQPFWGVSSPNITFTDTSTNYPTSWSWNFGDGGTSTLQNPSHIYTQRGYYNVSLTASNAGGSDNVTYINYIIVGQYVSGWRARYYSVEQSWDQANLAFTNNPPRIHFANNIALTNYSYLSSDIPDWPFPYLGFTEYYSCEYDGFINIPTNGTYTFYMWSDDGAVLTIDGSTVIDDNNLHAPRESTGSVYLTKGYHPINVKQWNHAEAAVISLEYSGPGISRTYVTDVYRIAAVYAPTAAFSASPTSGWTPLAVTFTDECNTDINHPTTWSWSFGDGDITYQTRQNPVHTYNTAGVYSVSLTATNDGGSSTVTKTNLITVRSSTHTITPSISSGSSYGSISPGSARTVADGGTQAFTITPNYNRYITSVTVDGVALSGFPKADNVAYTYTFTNVIVDHTISVVFHY
ncbi:PKD domain-containing protein [Methanoregula sp.]|uniref:PKD domain-containing protein n=1 Tax=Methanoregula sp. TaxID=2052170 RepID=UPI003567F177